MLSAAAMFLMASDSLLIAEAHLSAASDDPRDPFANSAYELIRFRISSNSSSPCPGLDAPTLHARSSSSVGVLHSRRHVSPHLRHVVAVGTIGVIRKWDALVLLMLESPLDLRHPHLQHADRRDGGPANCGAGNRHQLAGRLILRNLLGCCAAPTDDHRPDGVSTGWDVADQEYLFPAPGDVIGARGEVEEEAELVFLVGGGVSDTPLEKALEVAEEGLLGGVGEAVGESAGELG